MKVATLATSALLLLNSAEGIFGCDSWCVAPFCTCTGAWFFKFNSCNDGFSGDQCRCPFDRTNIADNSWLIPDSLTSSLVLEKTADGQTILAGTFKSAYESNANDINFSNLRSSSATENVWSVAKTSKGSYLMGTPGGILRRTGASTTLTQVYGSGNDGVQGGIVEFKGKLYAGSFEGIRVSSDDGLTWSEECSGSLLGEVCSRQVTKLMVHQDRLYAAFSSYGGMHYLDAQGWKALPKFQKADEEAAEDDICFMGFCQVDDAAILGNKLFVAVNARSPAVLDLSNPSAAWEKVNVSPFVSEQGAVGVAVAGDILFLASFDALFYSKDIGLTWEKVDRNPCENRKRPPGFGRGMIATNDKLIIGTNRGPWQFPLSFASSPNTALQIASASTSSSGSGETQKASSLPAGSIAGIAAGSVLAAGATVLVVVRRRRSQQAAVPDAMAVVADMPGQRQHANPLYEP